MDYDSITLAKKLCFVSLSPFLHVSEKYPRVDVFDKQGNQVWNDQQVTVDDSFERCSGYEYFGIIDHDEFFIPGKQKNLRETLVG